MLHAGLGGQTGGLVQLLLGHVDADHPPGRANLAGGEQAVHAGAASQVEHNLAAADGGQVEEEADAGEGVDRADRDSVELARRVAQALGQCPSRLEVELLLRVNRHIAVDPSDPLLEVFDVKDSGGH